MYKSLKDISEEKSLSGKLKKALIEWVMENNLTTGTRLPSEREFARLFNVSTITVTNVFSALEAEGIIEKIPRRGTYVKTALKRPFMIDVYIEHDFKEPLLNFEHMHHSYFLYREFLDGILMASADFNMSTCFEFIDKKNPLLSVKRSLFRDGAIFVNTEWPADFKNMLYEKKIPFVMIAAGHSGFKNSVGIRYGGLLKGLDELYGLGHRKFGLLTHKSREDHIRYFREWLKSKGIAERPEWDCILTGVKADSDYNILIDKYLEQDELPSAIISTSIIYTRTLLEISVRKGLRIPEDFSLLHSGEKHSVNTIDLKVNLDCLSFFKVAQEGVKQLSILLQNKESTFDEVLVNSEYISGDTFAVPATYRGERK